jgi:hypothetical protein
MNTIQEPLAIQPSGLMNTIQEPLAIQPSGLMKLKGNKGANQCRNLFVLEMYSNSRHANQQF